MAGLPAIAEWRFVTRPSFTKHGTRYSVRAIALMLEHIGDVIHDTVHRSPFFAAGAVDPDAAPLVKAAQIAAWTRHKTDALIEHLQYLDLSPVRSPALAAFAVELFRRFKGSLLPALMSIEVEDQYDHLCGILGAIVMGSTPCDRYGEIRHEPPV